MAFYNNGFIPGLQANILLAQIDENYNPDSENAQSGKAVAEAIKGVEGQIENCATKEYVDGAFSDIVVNGGGSIWKKLADITTTEEVNGIYATNEEYPLLYKCREFIIRVVFPMVSTGANTSLGAMRIFINNVMSFRANSITVSTSGIYETRCHTIIADTLIHSVGTENSRGHINVMGNAMMLVSNNVVDIPQEISAVLNDSTKYLPIGTKFVIYGKVAA